MLSKMFADFMIRALPEGQSDHWKWFLANAKEYDKIDWDASTALAKRYHSQPNRCYLNCALIASIETDLKYVEGVALAATEIGIPMPMSHGWLVREDGTILDPTFALHFEENKSVAPDYFGIELPTEFVGKHYSGPEAYLSGWLIYYMAEVQQEKTA